MSKTTALYVYDNQSLPIIWSGSEISWAYSAFRQDPKLRGYWVLACLPLMWLGSSEVAKLTAKVYTIVICTCLWVWIKKVPSEWPHLKNLNEKPSRKKIYLLDQTKAPIGPSTPRLPFLCTQTIKLYFREHYFTNVTMMEGPHYMWQAVRVIQMLWNICFRMVLCCIYVIVMETQL